MLKEVFPTYKRILILILLLICGTVVWFYGRLHWSADRGQEPVWEQKKTASGRGTRYYFRSGNISGTVMFGQEGLIPAGKTVPVKLTLTSRKDDFSGMLRITLPGENGNGIDFQLPVFCGADKSVSVVLPVPQMGNPACFGLEILNSFGTVVISRTVTPDWVERDDESGEVLVGVLTDRYSDLAYLDDMEIRAEDEPYHLRLAVYDTAHFPGTVEELSGLSGIMVDRADTKALSPRQIDSLKSFVEEEGGSLLVCAGREGSRNFGGLSDFLLADAGEEDTVYYRFSGMDSANGLTLTGDSIVTDPEAGWSGETLSTPETLYKRKAGRGTITLLSFSMADRTFRSWTGKEDLSRKVFGAFLGDELVNRYNEDIGQWYLASSLYSFMPSDRTETFYYGLFFIIYIGVIVICAYFILRKLRRREIVWIVIPLLSILFTIAMGVRSAGVSGSGDSSLSLLQIMDTGSRYDENYLLYRNGEGEAGSVSFLPQVRSVEPEGYEYRTEVMEVPNAACSKKDYTVNRMKDHYELSFSDTIPGTSYAVKMMADRGGKSRTIFSQDILPGDFHFSGSVTNVSRHNLSSVLILRGRQCLAFGPLGPGETLKADQTEPFFLAADAGESVLPDESRTRLTDSILPYLQMKYLSEPDNDNEIFIVGICTDYSSRVLSDENNLRDQISIFVNRFPADKTAGSYISDLNASCLREEDQEKIDRDTMQLLKSGILIPGEETAVYTFDENVKIERLIRNRDQFEGDILAYNRRTGGYEKILEEEESVLAGEALEPYILEDRVIRIRYLTEDIGQEEAEAPFLSAVTTPAGE